MKTKTPIYLLSLIVFFVFTAACNENPETSSANPETLKSDRIQDGSYTLISDEITTAEAVGLQFAYEEEKLARDVYTYFFGLYGSKVFENIMDAEQTHENAVKNLLDFYELDIPQAEYPFYFKSEILNDFYIQLTTQGQVSLKDALLAGALIEEQDIFELTNELEITESSNIINLYNVLIEGSQNHLRAFVKNLSFLDIAYTPVVLESGTYQAIIDTPIGEYGSKEKGK